MEVKYTIDKKEGAYVTATVTMPYSAFQDSYKELLTKESKGSQMKGFRKGKVPSQIVEGQLKQLLSIESFERLAPTYINEVAIKEQLEIIAPPEYLTIPSLEEEKDFEFQIKFTVMPMFKLGNMKDIKVKVEDSKITDEELKKTVEEMFKNTKGEYTEPTDKWAEETAKLYKLENVKDIKSLDEEVKKLLEKEKARIVRQNAENEVITKAIEISKIVMPEEAVNFEAREREKSFIHELRHANMSLEDFCKMQNTDIKELRSVWEKDSKEALEIDALLKLYSKDSKIEIKEEELEEEIKKMKETQKGPEYIYEDTMWRNNVKNVLMKQKAYKSLISETLKD